jgi:hypothetical protein
VINYPIKNIASGTGPKSFIQTFTGDVLYSRQCFKCWDFKLGPSFIIGQRQSEMDISNETTYNQLQTDSCHIDPHRSFGISGDNSFFPTFFF